MINFNKMEFSFKFIILLIFLIQVYESHKLYNITYEKLKAEIIEIKDYEKTIKSYQLSDFCKDETEFIMFLNNITCNSVNLKFDIKKPNSNSMKIKIVVGENYIKTIGIIYVSVNFYYKLDPKYVTQCMKKFGKKVCKKVPIPSNLTTEELKKMINEMYQKIYLQLIRILPYNKYQNLYNIFKKAFLYQAKIKLIKN